MKLNTQKIQIHHYIHVLIVVLMAAALLTGFFPASLPPASADDVPQSASVIYAASIAADTIVIGTVTGTVSYWNSEHTGICSSVVLAVDETLKGKVSGGAIVITYAGGEVEGVGQWTSDMPGFEPGEKTAVFLNKRSPEQASPTGDIKGNLPDEQFTLYGGYQGKYSITGDKAGDITLEKFKELVGQVLEGHFKLSGETGITTDGAALPYSYSGNSWPHPPAANIHYRINENTPDCTGEGAAVQAAAATWSAAGASFSFTYDGTTTANTYMADGVNEISWGALSNGTLAFTCIWYNPANFSIFECDMVFNEQYDWSTSDTPAPGQYDVQSLALHEFGHFLMLNDLYGAGDTVKIMYGVGIPGADRRTLNAADITAINDVYGTAAIAPAVSNGNTENITEVSALLNGEITSTGDENPTVHIYWGPGDGNTTASGWANDVNLGTLSASGFSANITGLSPGTTYYYRFYAANSAGGSWAAATASFTTPASFVADIYDSYGIMPGTNYLNAGKQSGGFFSNTAGENTIDANEAAGKVAAGSGEKPPEQNTLPAATRVSLMTPPSSFQPPSGAYTGILPGITGGGLMITAFSLFFIRRIRHRH